MADDTTARSRAWHEANDYTEKVNEVGPGDPWPSGQTEHNSRGEKADDAARRIEHERKNVDADDALVPVEDRKPREVPYDSGEAA